MKDPQLGPSIEVSQERATEKLEKIPVEKNITEDLHWSPTKHIEYRSLLRQINLLQSKRLFQCCYKFSRCAFESSFSNNWWCKSSQHDGANGETSILATHKTLENNCVSWCLLQSNEDGSSQRGVTVFFIRIARAFLQGWNVKKKSWWVRK